MERTFCNLHFSVGHILVNVNSEILSKARNANASILRVRASIDHFS